MWVIFFQGTPHFWLIGGETYRAGKKDCHVVIQDDRSISRTHLTITVGLQPVPSSTSSSPLASSQARAPPGGQAHDHHHHHSAQPHHAEDKESGAPQPITLLDSSTYGTSVAACGSTDSDDADTNDDSGGGGSRVSPALDMTGVLGLCYAPAARKRQRSHGSVPRASAAPAAPQPTLQLTKEVPYHVPVHRRAWQEFVVRLGHHGATLTFVWVDVAVLCEDVDVEVQTKLTNALRCCGVRQVVVPGSVTEEGDDTLTHVTNSAPADGASGSAAYDSREVAQLHPTSRFTLLGGSGLSLTQRTGSGTDVQAVSGTHITASPTPQTSAAAAAATRAAVTSPASSSCAPQRCYSAVSFLVTSAVQPSTAVVAMLCRAVPIVSPAFFLAIRDRVSPQMPLPDPADYLPPLAAWWLEMLIHVALPPPSASVSAAATSQTATTSSPASAGSSTTTTAAESLQEQQQRRCFAPHPERRHLFRGTTFVLVQRQLYDEVVSYLDGAGAEVAWADVEASGLGGLSAWIGSGCSGSVSDIDCCATAARDATAALQGFFAQHQRSVLLYSETELGVPWADAAVTALRHGLGLCTVEYAQLVESIVSMRPLTLPPYPMLASVPQTLAEVVARIAVTEGRSGDGGDDEVDVDRTQDGEPPEESEEGRRTDAQPLFPDLGRDAAGMAGVAVPPACSGGGIGGRPPSSAARVHHRPRSENAEGWVSFAAAPPAGGGGDGAPPAAPFSAAKAASARTAELHLEPLALPSYPCFAEVLPADGATTVSAGGAAHASARLFVKQSLPPCEPLAELEQHRARQQLAASMLTARVPTVDAEGVVPDQVVMGGGRGGLAGRVAAAELASGIAFNAFDTAAHHASSRRRGTVARRGGRGAPRAARSRGGAAARVDVDVDAAEGVAVVDATDGYIDEVPAGPPRATVPTSSTDSTFHIFDIDGIF